MSNLAAKGLTVEYQNSQFPPIKSSRELLPAASIPTRNINRFKNKHPIRAVFMTSIIGLTLYLFYNLEERWRENINQTVGKIYA